jgi:hypothetical protein
MPSRFDHFRTTTHPRRLALLPFLVPFVLIGLHCSNDSPTSTPHDSFQALAGGGRGEDNDPFTGGPNGSGPNEGGPGIPDIDPGYGYRPIVFLDVACGEAPAQVVIEDSTAWRAWWEANVSCDSAGAPGVLARTMARHGSRGALSDSGWVDPDSSDPGDPWALPYVDFSTDVVVAITLERAQDDRRTLVVDGVESGAAGTLITYTVYRPGEDCDFYSRDSLDMTETAPAIAVVVPRPLPAPFTYDRRDTTFDCSWEPDPDTPLMLYYTDAPCALGDGEEIVVTQEAWDAWVALALECDLDRWDVVYDSSRAEGDSGWSPGGDPTDPSVPAGYSIPVDFEQFAVILLRAGDQDRWGGGIWLTDLETSESGTRVEYTVVVPGSECPPVADSPYFLGDVVNPTVAIRVPLPLPEPITWDRLTRTIDCDWGSGGDSAVIIIEPDSVRVP